MAARVCAWKTPVTVTLGDHGDFVMSVKRIPVDQRGEQQEFYKRVRAGVKDEDTAAVTKQFREQLSEMVLGVGGIEFEWAEDDVEAPDTIEALLDALERYEPLRINECVGTLWATCVEAQFLSPFFTRPSASTLASSSGAAD